jgi:hypothetical protein
MKLIPASKLLQPVIKLIQSSARCRRRWQFLYEDPFEGLVSPIEIEMFGNPPKCAMLVSDISQRVGHARIRQLTFE